MPDIPPQPEPEVSQEKLLGHKRSTLIWLGVGTVLLLAVGVVAGYMIGNNQDAKMLKPAVSQPQQDTANVPDISTSPVSVSPISASPTPISPDITSSTTPTESVTTLADGQYEVTIIGGYDTNPVDGGRPVLLIASILGVAEQVFRDAFSNVTPEDQGHLNPETAQANKAILLAALGPYGLTNDQIDEATNYYRYPPGSTTIWPTTDAEITATVQNGTVTSFNVVSGGAGYNSEPTLEVSGNTVAADITMLYSQDFSTNGSITAVTPK